MASRKAKASQDAHGTALRLVAVGRKIRKMARDGAPDHEIDPLRRRFLHWLKAYRAVYGRSILDEVDL